MAILIIFSLEDMKNKKEQEESSLKDQLNSTQIDTSQSEHTKMSSLTNQFQNNNSKLKSQESKDFDHRYGLLFLPFLFVFCISRLIFINTNERIHKLETKIFF